MSGLDGLGWPADDAPQSVPSSDCSALVDAIKDLNMHITVLASCNSVTAGFARIAAEKDRAVLVSALIGRAQNTDISDKARNQD